MKAPYAISKVLKDRRVAHGFFGREGGISTGPFASNNMSIAIGDDPQIVDRNRTSASAAMRRKRADLVLFKQIHSTRIVTLTERPDPAIAVEADAMVTNRADLLLGILTADCAPVLLTDSEAGVVGAAHAGWKGAAGGILRHTIAAMVALGAEPARIAAAIGPTISFANYEIGPETAAQIIGLDAAAAGHIGIPEGKIRAHFNIPAFLTEQLFGLGIGLVGDLDLCTYASAERYFSHRRATHEQTTTGRQIALIGLVNRANGTLHPL